MPSLTPRLGQANMTKSRLRGGLMLIGNRGGTNIGASLEGASIKRGLSTQMMESRLAMEAPGWMRLAMWHLMDHTPPRLRSFSKSVFKACEFGGPHVLLTTGMAPVTAGDLARIRTLGIRCANFSTDDPWNPEHRSKWFLQALKEYDTIFTPRQANVDQLQAASRAKVVFLPFGYDPHLFFPANLTSDEKSSFESDVTFAGGADGDRAPYIGALHRAGFKVSLYGSYWERYQETRRLTRGQADPPVLRKAISGAKVALCLVRRANRDGHAMRTYEVPAMKACMLVERTTDHKNLFGPEGAAVLYFDSIPEMVEKVSWLLERPDERRRLAESAHRIVVDGKHTYEDRLKTILAAVAGGADE